MTILAVDTSTLVSSIALLRNDILLAEFTLQIRKTHSEQLMPHISQLFEFAGLSLSDLQAVAVSSGPGSFTGLRIGLATAKALAYARRVKLIGVPTLEALAYACPVPGVYVAPLMDAQKDNVYQAVYTWEKQQLIEVAAVKVSSIEETVRELALLPKPVMVLGEAALLYRKELSTAANVIFLPPHLAIARAANVALRGAELLAAGIEHDVMELEPLYIRRSEAEVLWEKRNRSLL